MGKLRAKIIVSFRAKVLLPVIVVMVGLLAITVWMVNQRITEQFETDAKRTLHAADAKFRALHTLRLRNMLLRFRNLPSEPRYMSTFQKRDDDTIRDQLLTIKAEQDLDVVWFVPNDVEAQPAREPLIKSSDYFLPVNDFVAAAKFAAQGAPETGG